MAALNICFERVNPTPSYPAGLSKVDFQGMNWSSQSNASRDFKENLKQALRELQVGRCCYCRRQLGNVQDTHLEHFIEKSAFPDYSFAPCNLALSCSTCNTLKNANFLKISKRISKSESRRLGTKVTKLVSPVLKNGACNDLFDVDEYRWIHPHFDDFSSHLSIKKNWIFVPKTTKGARCKKALRFNDVYLLEQRAAAERLAGISSTLAFMAATVALSDHFRTSTIAAIVGNEIRRRRGLKHV